MSETEILLSQWHVHDYPDADGRPIVVVHLSQGVGDEKNLEAREQAMYLSTGTSSGRASTWLPFNGIADMWDARRRFYQRNWFHKHGFVSVQRLVLERFGSVQVARASMRLGGGIWSGSKGANLARALALDYANEVGVDAPRLVVGKCHICREATRSVKASTYVSIDKLSLLERTKLDEIARDTRASKDGTAFARHINSVIGTSNLQNIDFEERRQTSQPGGVVSIVDSRLASKTTVTANDRLAVQHLIDSLESTDDSRVSEAALALRQHLDRSFF